MCGVTVVAEDDRVVSVRGDEDDPFSRGHICPKALALQDLHEDPDRLRHPMRRKGDRWEATSWESALDEAAERIHAIQKRDGNDAVAVYSGNPLAHNLPALLFGPLLLKGLRTRNRFSATSVDQLPHMFASYQMFGHQLLFPIPDIDRCDYMLVLGANPLASNGSIMTAPDVRRRLREVRERGAVVVVDPRRTETAKFASAHNFIRPGTDAYFLLALVREVIARGAKLGRLEPYIEGLDSLTDLCAPYTPERASAVTGIPASDIVEIAHNLHETERAVVYGRMGTCTQEFGGLSAWLLNALNLVAGNFDRPGGAMFSTPAVDLLKAAAGLGVRRGSFGRWRSRVRALPEFGGELPVSCLAEEIQASGKGQIRALITLAGNPVLSTPNGQGLDAALASLDFMVSVDPYINETSRHAHLILPSVSALERPHYDLVFHALGVRNTAKYSPPMFAPPRDGKDDGQIAIGLLRRIEERRGGRLSRRALEARALERAGTERLLDLGLRLGPYGAGFLGFKPRSLGERGTLSLAELERHPHGVDLGALMPSMPERLPPEQPKIQLAPEAYREDLARLASREHEVASGLRLIGRRHLRSNNSWMHNVSSLMTGRDRCTLMMHPDDVASLGLGDAAQVEITSRVGRVVAPLEVTRDVMPGVVSLPHGFGHQRKGVRLSVASEHAGVSVNDLTDHEHLDALTGNAALNGVPVEVRAAV